MKIVVVASSPQLELSPSSSNSVFKNVQKLVSFELFTSLHLNEVTLVFYDDLALHSSYNGSKWAKNLDQARGRGVHGVVIVYIVVTIASRSNFIALIARRQHYQTTLPIPLE